MGVYVWLVKWVRELENVTRYVKAWVRGCSERICQRVRERVC